jgi:phosphatidylserine synthase
VFAYLVTGALLYHVALSPALWMTVIVGLRLVRHASEGFGQSGDTSYYVGWTVVHVNFVVLATFYLALFAPRFTEWLAAVPIVAACRLMVSGCKSYRTHVSHALAGLFVVVACTISCLVAFTGML